MIISAEAFQRKERVFWDELEGELDALDRDAARALTLDEALRLHYLYRRTAADLNKLRALPSEVDLHAHLESLVARAYAEIHEARTLSLTRRLGGWFRRTLPQAFRRRWGAFAVSLGLMAIGACFGAFAVEFDAKSKSVLLPFDHLQGDPSERVAFEENQVGDRMSGAKSTFSATLMVNNIRVSITALALGMTYGIGTIIALFYNGVILGAVCWDYLRAGEGVFLVGWLLPHGSVEIPAILLAGQTGLVLAYALIGWGTSLDLRSRLRSVRSDLVTLMFGIALLLVWAGIVEAFFSQYHEPYLPYWLKISFGFTQLTLLFYYLIRVGRPRVEDSLALDSR